MKRHLQMLRSVSTLLILLAGILPIPSPAQQLAKRLILQDGSYQLATKWEIKGDRVRYLSAERNEWEEIPKALVDWPATDKYEKDRAAGAPAPEAVELDKELAAERAADEAKTPHVAPGLQLPEQGGVILFDTFQSQPQLVELQQTGSEINKNTKGNILRAAINPISSAKQTIELRGLHSKIQAHATLPAIYVNVEQQDQSGDPSSRQSPQQPQAAQNPQGAWDRFRLIHLDQKQGKRIVGDIKIAVYGKVSQEGKYVPTTAEKLTGGWVKITPTNSLVPGEYAVVETLGSDGMNLYVWDFGVNPAAPANMSVWKPDASTVVPAPDQVKELEKR